MNVCDNLGDHLVGNVYVKFRYEEDAEKAVNQVNNRWYNGKNDGYSHLKGNYFLWELLLRFFAELNFADFRIPNFRT